VIDFDVNDQNSLVYQLGESGFQAVIAEGVFNRTIPDSSWVVESMISVSELDEGSKLFYHYDLYAYDGYGNSARLSYTVSYDTTTSTPDVIYTQITDIVRVW